MASCLSGIGLRIVSLFPWIFFRCLRNGVDAFAGTPYTRSFTCSVKSLKWNHKNHKKSELTLKAVQCSFFNLKIKQAKSKQNWYTSKNTSNDLLSWKNELIEISYFILKLAHLSTRSIYVERRATAKSLSVWKPSSLLRPRHWSNVFSFTGRFFSDWLLLGLPLPFFPVTADISVPQTTQRRQERTQFYFHHSITHHC